MCMLDGRVQTFVQFTIDLEQVAMIIYRFCQLFLAQIPGVLYTHQRGDNSIYIARSICILDLMHMSSILEG